MAVDIPRVLVVSESRITRRVAEATFADQNVDVALASTGQQGLDAWATQAAAVVVVDLSLESPDGLTVARQVAAASPSPAVIALAGPNDAVDEDAVAAAGVRALLRKPIDSKQLMDAVWAALLAPSEMATPRPRSAMPVDPPTAPWSPAPMMPMVDDGLLPAVPPGEALERWGVPPPEAAVPPVPGSAEAGVSTLTDDDLERVAARVMALWESRLATGASAGEMLTLHAEHVAADSATAALERVAPQAAAAAAERLVRELAPRLVEQVARVVVTDVSERLVREEIVRLRSVHHAR